eukprot:CAMPEP_0178415222 /NCGR_PEP_ID=MMETSP0689_2-20121128/23441_1 /TAXON_ID=160604 /ORGANISM="Amphidinium massartii, Strain CS-259" /LENGTH=502 /DNA_ID=CAMNT_0020036537 /DNA_START=20 /DNA_END=1528 /DNA_ORIENTATION=-
MASNTLNQPLLQDGEQEQSRVPEWARKAGIKCCKYFGLVALVFFMIVGIIQLITYNFALFGCSASKLQDYAFPGGGTSTSGGPAYNLVPQLALLIERDPVWWGSGYDLFPSDAASTISGASTGFFYKTWGPLFNTYAYEDTATSRVTLYMRQRFPQSYLFMSHVIARCDGQGPSVIVTEGSGGFIMNRIRALFKMNQGYHFQVWLDNEMVGVAQEIGQHGSGIPSILFRNASGSTMGSSTLQSRHFHGNKDEWLVTNEEDTAIPYYANAALTLQYAFHVHNHMSKKVDDLIKDRDAKKDSVFAAEGDSTDAKVLQSTDSDLAQSQIVATQEKSPTSAASEETAEKKATAFLASAPVSEAATDSKEEQAPKEDGETAADKKSAATEEPKDKEAVAAKSPEPQTPTEQPQQAQQEQQRERAEGEKWREVGEEEEAKYRGKEQREREHREEGLEEGREFNEEDKYRHEREEDSKKAVEEPADKKEESKKEEVEPAKDDATSKVVV